MSPYSSVRVSPYNAAFNHGGSVNLTCLAEGGPGNTFQWSFNGTILGTQDYTLLFPSITAEEDGGYYTCTVFNDAGNGSNTTALFLNPIITRQPTDVLLVHPFGDLGIAILTCEASAFPYPEYNWVHANGIFTPFASGVNTSTLTLYGVVEGSEGDYYCTATSNGVSVVSERATVFGEYLKPLMCVIEPCSYSVSPSNVSINSTRLEFAYEEGDTVYLTCMHNGGPNNTYTWRINGRQLSNTAQTLIHTISLADEDGGSYSCLVINPAGERSAEISIFTVPSVFTSPVDAFSLVGGSVSLSCGARGFPAPSYQWSKTGGSLPNTTNITEEGGISTLAILLVQLQDHGEYNCIVSGSGNDTIRSAVLTGESNY